MPTDGLYRALVLLEFALCVPTFVSLRFVTAPYGRHSRTGWGATVPARVGWIVMESPAPLVFLAVYAVGPHRTDPVPLLFLAMWLLHYLYRAYVYPMRLRSDGHRMPVSVMALAIGFNLLNAYINARWISAYGRYPVAWLVDPRMIAGIILFGGGLWLNINSDRRLRALRAPGESGYRIPHGGAFEFVSCPNYLGEMVEWAGWALAAWSPAGLAFACYTAANLAPRARSHHLWYRRQFPDYPRRRRALIPFLL